jgi:hypothetical protein
MPELLCRVPIRVPIAARHKKSPASEGALTGLGVVDSPDGHAVEGLPAAVILRQRSASGKISSTAPARQAGAEAAKEKPRRGETGRRW